MFFDKGHAYAARILEKDGVELRLGVGVKAIGPGHVTLSDGSTIKTRCVIWGGGLMAAPVAGASGLPQGRGGRIDVGPDFTVAGFPGVLVIGDIANIPAKDGKTYPQLGSVALQSGSSAAGTILADIEGKHAEAVQLPRQGDDGDDRPRRGHRPGQGRRAARQDRLRGLAGRPRRAHDRRQQSRQRVQELGDATSSARTGRPRRSTGAARPGWSGTRTSRTSRSPGGRDHLTHRAARDDREGIMSSDGRYDVIIIGSGAGGGTLARHLAPSGKRILILERGDWLPREPENWDSKEVFVDNRYVPKETWYDDKDKPFQPGIHYAVGGATKMYGAALYRLRPEDFGELRHHDGISPAWPISYDDMEPYYTQGRAAVRGPRQPRRGLDRGPRERPVPVPGADPRAAHPAAVGRPGEGRLPPVPRALRRPAAGGRPTQQPVHPVPDLRRLPVPRPGQVRRGDARRPAGAGAQERQPPDAGDRHPARDERGRARPSSGSSSSATAPTRRTTPTSSSSRRARPTRPRSCSPRPTTGTRTGSPTAPARSVGTTCSTTAWRSWRSPRNRTRRCSRRRSGSTTSTSGCPASTSRWATSRWSASPTPRCSRARSRSRPSSRRCSR